MDKFKQLVERYNTIVLDAYGVFVLDGQVYEPAAKTLEQLVKMGKKVIILSNATYTDPVSRYARKGLIEGKHFTSFFTSGQFCREDALQANFPIRGLKMYVYGTANFKRPEKLPDIFKDTPYQVEEDITKADFVYIGIPQINGEDRLEMDDFMPGLGCIRDMYIPCICSNPDLRANEGGRWVVRQGLVADTLSKMGVRVVRYGKPDPAIFDWVAEKSHSDLSDMLMVGDTLWTDILGANRAGVDSCLTLTGGVTEMEMKKRGLTDIQQLIDQIDNKCGTPSFIVKNIWD